MATRSTAPFARGQHFHDAVRIEPLTEEIAVQALKLVVAGNAVAPAQPLVHHRLDLRALVDGCECVVGRALRCRGRDTRLLDALPDPPFAAPVERRLGPRDGFGHARVVNRALVAKACDGRVDGVRVVAPPRQSLAYLGFG